MKLKIFKTLWGHGGSHREAVEQCAAAGFDGIEAPAPEDAAARREFSAHLREYGLGFIQEICTAGSYVPRRDATSAEHLETFRVQVERAAGCGPLFITAVAGCDGWSIGESVEFFGAAKECARQLGRIVSFETHRSRSLFNPWTARDILRQLPEMKLTCDFSHWCVVCERLLDTEPDILALCAERAFHLHARIGYEQGPQVPDPAAPEYAYALAAHERWWDAIWENQRARGLDISTMTPEFGPDGYLHCQPYTGMPVADLWQINQWVAQRQKRRFDKRFECAVSASPGQQAA